MPLDYLDLVYLMRPMFSLWAAVDRDGELISHPGYPSSYGKNSVHIAAMGDRVLSTYSRVPHFSGTSAAAPVVTAMAAGILAANPNLSVGALKDRLLAQALRDPRLTDKVSGGRLAPTYLMPGTHSLPGTS